MKCIILISLICAFGLSAELKEFSYPKFPEVQTPEIKAPNINSPVLNTPHFKPQDPPKDSTYTQKINAILADLRESHLQLRSYCLPQDFWSPSPPKASQLEKIGLSLRLSKVQYMSFMDILQENILILLQKPILESSLNGELIGTSCVIEFWEVTPKAEQKKHFIHIADVIQIDDMFFEKSLIVTQDLRKYFCNIKAQP